MATKEARTVSRDIEAAAIPWGDLVPLAVGSTVYVTQSLGGSFTVMTDRGYMVRIEGKDADAIGEQPAPAPTEGDAAGKTVQQQAWDQLRTCFDPEIPVNIVDLGLVYQCDVAPRAEGGDKITVRFTLTAPGCGMGDYLRRDVEQKLGGLPGVEEVDVQVVLDPPWNQTMMSDSARLQLGLM